MSVAQADEHGPFRQQVRDWLKLHFVDSLRQKSGWSIDSPPDHSPDVLAWTRAMGEKGWGVPTWPKEYGGGGLTHAEARVLEDEMRRYGAWNPIDSLGVQLLGPTLLEFGSEAQKRKHLPGLARKETNWCQGFSEPGAGSDLAALTTSAEDRGDHFLVNGQKVWTSGAEWCDWIFCLVRTDTSRKQGGISFLLIDMSDPGIEVRPIKLIAGSSPFCETYFSNVKVPKENLVGQINGGWTIAKRLLQFERGGDIAAGIVPDTSGQMGGGSFGVDGSPAELAKTCIGVDATGRIDDPDLRARITRYAIDKQAFQLTVQRLEAEMKAGQGMPPGLAIVKLAGTVINQQAAELMIESMGNRGLGWEGGDATERELGMIRGWLAGKATTIFGGTTEVQYNILSKHFLGLPEAARKA